MGVDGRAVRWLAVAGMLLALAAVVGVMSCSHHGLWKEDGVSAGWQGVSADGVSLDFERGCRLADTIDRRRDVGDDCRSMRAAGIGAFCSWLGAAVLLAVSVVVSVLSLVRMWRCRGRGEVWAAVGATLATVLLGLGCEVYSHHVRRYMKGGKPDIGMIGAWAGLVVSLLAWLVLVGTTVGACCRRCRDDGGEEGGGAAGYRAVGQDEDDDFLA